MVGPAGIPGWKSEDYERANRAHYITRERITALVDGMADVDEVRELRKRTSIGRSIRDIVMNLFLAGTLAATVLMGARIVKEKQEPPYAAALDNLYSAIIGSLHKDIDVVESGTENRRDIYYQGLGIIVERAHVGGNVGTFVFLKEVDGRLFDMKSRQVYYPVGTAGDSLIMYTTTEPVE